MDREYACCQFVSAEKIFEEVRSVHPRDALERETDEPAAGVVHKVVRLALDSDELLLLYGKWADRDCILGHSAGNPTCAL